MATFNTTDPKPGYVYDQAVDTWFPLLGIAPGSNIVRWRKTAAGAETSVSGLDDLGATLSYNAGTEQVYLNGVLLVRTEDYLATNGTSVTGLTALAASDVIEVISFNATNVQTTDALLETDINAKGDLIVGAAVDTAAILASGTNGQVLAVNTSTATGLEWVTSDDANAIQNAIVDAKGDLIVATAADTVARLASSASNGDLLTVDTSTATGLKWAAPAGGGGALVQTGTGTFSSSGGGSVSNCFSATYNNYMVVIDSLRNESAGNYQLALYLRTGSTNATADYNTQITQNLNGTVSGNTKTTMLAFIHNNGTANEKASSVLWIQQPFAAAYTTFQYLNASLDRTDFGGGNHAQNTSYASLGWLPDDGGSNSFNITVYGLEI